MFIAGRHPLKQGLKPLSLDAVLMCHAAIAGRHPLKQGLKLCVCDNGFSFNHDRRATSTKTRIETEVEYQGDDVLHNRRATSTKTRIETSY